MKLGEEGIDPRGTVKVTTGGDSEIQATLGARRSAHNDKLRADPNEIQVVSYRRELGTKTSTQSESTGGSSTGGMYSTSRGKVV